MQRVRTAKPELIDFDGDFRVNMYRAELYSDTIDTKYDETQLDELVDILKNNQMQTGSARDGRFADGRAQYL